MSLATGGLATVEATSRASDKRAALVTALATVPGLTAYAVTPDAVAAGAAWPKWVQTTYNGKLCSLAVDTYEILVTLPASYLATTVDEGDKFRDLVAEAVMTVAIVTFAEPVLIPFQDNQTMPGLRLRITIR